MSKKKPLEKITTNSAVDYETGEVLVTDIQAEKIYVDREPDFVKLYLTDIMRLKGLPESNNEILMALLSGINYHNQVFITKTTKDLVTSQLKISDKTFTRAIKAFVDKGLLIKFDAHTYVVNPHTFGRGKWTDIKKIRMLVEYSEAGRVLLNYEEYKKQIEMQKIEFNRQPTLF